jgi:phosphocarrier protein
MRVHDLTVSFDFEPRNLQTLSLQASRFSSDIWVEFTSDQGNLSIVDVKSLLGMMLLPIRKGTVITIKTRGSDEKEAIDFMVDAIAKCYR